MEGGGGAAGRLRGSCPRRQLRRVARLRPYLGGRAGEARLARRARCTMSDASGGKKPPVEPQAGPGPGRAAGERVLPGSFPLVLKKLMENPPREARLGEGRRRGGGPSALGRGFCRGGPCGGGVGEVGGPGEVAPRRGMGPEMTRILGG